MVTQIASEPCAGCEVDAVVSFYGVYGFTPWAADAGDRPMLDRIFGQWNADVLKRYSPLFHIRGDMPPALLIQGTKDELFAGTLAYAEGLKKAGVRPAPSGRRYLYDCAGGFGTGASCGYCRTAGGSVMMAKEALCVNRVLRTTTVAALNVTPCAPMCECCAAIP